MGDKKVLNENDILQVSGGMVAGLEEISVDELENEQERNKTEEKR